jgi:TonB-dependent receptor
MRTTNHLALRALLCGASAMAVICAASPAIAQDTAQDTTGQTSAGDAKKPAANSTDIQSQAAPAPTPVTDAQLGAPAGGNDIVVTGIRQSLATAQSIKRNAATVVDAISAEDIGALPDRSINEALQRVPGVAISRFAAPNDSQHFSVQGSGVTIRGLDGLTKGEFNGRDTFAVSGGREIGYNDVPSELAGSVEVYKNMTADMIEGGIAGTVSINTRKPFDTKQRVLFLSGGVNYGDLVSASAPSVVGLYSQQWQTKGGSRFGLLVGGSYDNIKSRADSEFLSSYLPRFNAPDDGVDGYAPNGTDYQGTQYDGVLCDGNNPNEGKIINAGKPYAIRVCDSFQTPDGFSQVYTPSGAGVRTQSFNIKRTSIEAGAQFENPSGNLLVTAGYLRADYRESWLEHTIEPNVYYNDVGNTYPAGMINPDGSFNPNGTSDFTYDSNGVFTSGTIYHRGNLQAHNVTTPCTIPNNGNPYQSTYCPYTNFVNPGGINTDFSNRHFSTQSLTQDASLNVKWEPTDRLHLNLDGQYVSSHSENVDDIVDIYTYSDVAIDLRGSVPKISFLTPGFDTATYFNDPGTHFFNDAMNNRAINDGHEWAFQADAKYDISDEGFLRDVKVGARYSDREQTVRTNNYSNWGSLSATWTNEGPSYLSAFPDQISSYAFNNFFRGQGATPPVSPYISPAVLENHDALEALLRQAKDTTTPGQFSYTPLEDRGSDLIDGYFLPGEIYTNSEKTWAGYAMLDFSTGEFAGGMKLSGNVGVRWVHTEDGSVGAITFPQPSTVIPDSYNGDFTAYCNQVNDQNSHADPGTSTSIPAVCKPGVTDAYRQSLLAFASGASVPQTAVQKYDNWLPSVNLRLDVTPKFLVRFAASEGISRPNFADLSNYVSINYDGTGGSFSARASNPYLLPTKARQFDLTAEWYFARVGSLTGALFYKDLTNVILQNSPFTRTVENNGVSETLGLTGPGNASGHTKVKGAELAYQQTFDFLPGALSGFGTQATFTYIDAGSVQIAPPSYQAPTVPYTGNGQQPPLDITGLYDNLPLPGLSKYNYNISGFYDKYGLYLRLAYSWRSRFLLTPQDCCFPFLPVYQDASGQLDGSLFITVNKQFKIGFEVQNITDTTVKTRFRLNGDDLTAPRSYFKSDRQYQMTVRLTL